MSDNRSFMFSFCNLYITLLRNDFCDHEKFRENICKKQDVNLQKGQFDCIFVVQFGGESSESIVKRREVYEADTKGLRRIAEEFYAYIVS